MNDLVKTAAGLPADLGWTIKDVVTVEELRNMPLGMRIDFVPELRAHFENMAREMAASDLTREHLKDKPAECLSVIKNALNWGMDPRAVAGKTYAPGKGQIGIEGVLAAAIIMRSGRVTEIQYEYGGDWSKVVGKWGREQAKWPDGNPKFSKFTDKTGKKQPVMVNAAQWKPEDEEGLYVVAVATKPNGQEVRTPEIYLNECHPRNAQTWPTAPKRQIIHVAERVLCNMICGDILMGVHIDVGLTRDFEDTPRTEPRDVTPKATADEVQADIRGTGATEPMQEGGYTIIDQKDVTTEEDDLVNPETGEVLEEKPKRTRVKLTFRGKEISKTNFLRDVKQMIKTCEDAGELETLEDEVVDAYTPAGFTISQINDFKDKLAPLFDKRFLELQVDDAGGARDDDFGGIDLTGDDG